MEQAQKELSDGLLGRGIDLAAFSDEDRKNVTALFLVGDPDTVAEQLAEDLQLGIDGFTINAVLNGHIPERVALLGHTASKVIK